jgi:tRNA (guanine-N7-)-methyltransferase
MARKKLKRLKEVYKFPNVFSSENENVEELLNYYFGNRKSFTLEIGCGHGDYTIELAKMYPERNFIGIDYKGDRIYAAAEKAIELNLKNAAFLVSGAEKLSDIFSKEKVEEIFIPFPDPHYPRKSFKRLVAKNFLNVYKNIVTEKAKGHFKTDNEELYNYTLNILNTENCNIHFATSNLYGEQDLAHHHTIKTKYEKQYLDEGKEIKYICFGFENKSLHSINPSEGNKYII